MSNGRKHRYCPMCAWWEDLPPKHTPTTGAAAGIRVSYINETKIYHYRNKSVTDPTTQLYPLQSIKRTKYNEFERACIDYLTKRVVRKENEEIEGGIKLYQIWNEFESWLWPKIQKLPVYAANPHTANRCAVIVDGRSEIRIPLVIKHTMNMLNKGGTDMKWSVIVYHTAENQEFLVKHLNVTKKSPVMFKRIKDMTWDAYNALVMSSEFYLNLPSNCEHVLIFQSDVIQRKMDNLDKFIDYMYVGAVTISNVLFSLLFMHSAFYYYLHLFLILLFLFVISFLCLFC